MTKFCKDCKFAKKVRMFSLDFNYAKCTAAETEEKTGVDLVTGQTNPSDYPYCKISREFSHMCGPDAKFFQPKGGAPL